MSKKFIEKGSEDTLLYADVIVHITKHEREYIVSISSDMKTKEDENFSHNKCSFFKFLDFENFIQEYSPRNIYYSIYKSPTYEGDI